MPAKRSKLQTATGTTVRATEVHTQEAANGRNGSHAGAIHMMSGNRKLRCFMSARGTMSAKNPASANEYICAIERNQNGKYSVRVRAVFGRNGWTLPVYFLASSFNAAMKKLEESLQHLQKSEESLRFWGVERTDDPNLAGDFLREYGLWLDRRKEFPRKAAELGVPRERPVPASLLAPVRRILADSMAQERPSIAAAGD
jgi:hypothetical protein